MYRISKDFTWSASHQLDGLTAGHQCGRLHGHNYVAQVAIESDTLNEVGFVVDFGELWFLKDYLDNTWDHRHMNDEMDGNPTAERMAEHLAEYVAEVLSTLELGRWRVAVTVWETPKCSATFTTEWIQS